MTPEEFLRALAAWALVHEVADDGWKAAVARGSDSAAGTGQGSESFVDVLSALVAREKERLKSAIGSEPGADSAGMDPGQEAIRFEIAELRGRIEALQASVDALASRGQAES